MINTKFLIVANSEQGGKRTGLGRVHRSQLSMSFSLKRAEANVAKLILLVKLVGRYKIVYSYQIFVCTSEIFNKIVYFR